MPELITTQEDLDAAVESGKVAHVGRSSRWLHARAGSTVHAWKGSTVIAEAGSTVDALEGSTVIAEAGSTVHAWTGSTVYAWTGSTVTALEGSTVDALEGSTVYAEDGSTVIDKGGEILPPPNEATLSEQASFNRTVAQWIIANPDSFDMSSWHCGTTMCWAGAAVHLAGDRGAALKEEKGYAAAAGVLCGTEMIPHFYRVADTDAMRRFAEAIAEGKTIKEAEVAAFSAEVE